MTAAQTIAARYENILFNIQYLLVIFHKDIILSAIQEIFALVVHERQVAHRVDFECEHLGSPCLNQSLLEMLEFFHRTGDFADRIANVPLDSLHSIHFAGILHRHRSCNFSVLGNLVGGQLNRRIFELTVTQAITELIHRFYLNILVPSLRTPSRRTPAVVIDRNLAGGIRESHRKTT